MLTNFEFKEAFIDIRKKTLSFVSNHLFLFLTGPFDIAMGTFKINKC